VTLLFAVGAVHTLWLRVTSARIVTFAAVMAKWVVAASFRWVAELVALKALGDAGFFYEKFAV